MGLGRHEFDHYCFEIYIKLLYHLRSRSKIDIVKRQSHKLEIPYREMEDLFAHYFDGMNRNKQIQTERKETLIKQAEASVALSSGILKVDFDFAMFQLLKFDSDSGRNFPRQFYVAADTNGDGSLDLGEFERMLRHIEPHFYRIHRRAIKMIFNSYAVTSQDSPERILTPLVFEKLCQEKQIFNQKSFESFFQEQQMSGLCKSIQEVVFEWDRIKPRVKHNLSFCDDIGLQQLFSKVDFLITQVKVNVSKEQLATESQSTIVTDQGPVSNDLRRIWLNYKLLEKETERMHSELFVANLLPDQLIKLEELLIQVGIDV